VAAFNEGVKVRECFDFGDSYEKGKGLDIIYNAVGALMPKAGRKRRTLFDPNRHDVTNSFCFSELSKVTPGSQNYCSENRKLKKMSRRIC
jgi:hypothetical protein